MPPIVEVEDLAVAFPRTDGGVALVLDGVTLASRGRRGDGARRRVGVRQEPDRARDRAAAAAGRPGRPGIGAARGGGRPGGDGGAPVRAAGRARGARLSGALAGAQPGALRRLAGDRGGEAPPRRARRRRRGARPPSAGGGRPRRSPTGWRAPTRTSSRAARGSASSWPRRWPPVRGCSSPTSRPRRSTPCPSSAWSSSSDDCGRAGV